MFSAVTVKRIEQPQYEITLKLSASQAEGLLSMTGIIGGSSTSLRGVFDELNRSLTQAGAKRDDTQINYAVSKDGIYFEESTK